MISHFCLPLNVLNFAGPSLAIEALVNWKLYWHGESMAPQVTSATGSARAITVSVNEQSVTVSDTTSVAQLLDQLSMPVANGVAVAINDCVVRRSQWDGHPLIDGDQVLVIQATQGG